MQIIFHTDPEGQDGGLHVKVHQMPCGLFEPLGSLAGVNAISHGSPQFVPSSTFSPVSTHVDIADFQNTNHIGSHHTGGHFDIIQTTTHGNKKPSIGYGVPPPSSGYGAPPPSTHHEGHTETFVSPPSTHVSPPPSYHYLYYYLPSGKYKRPQTQTTQSKSKGNYDFVRMMQNKFDNFAANFQFEKGYSGSKGKLFGKSEGRHKRPYSRPEVLVQTNPIRYRYVKNPYYRPKTKKPAVRHRYPQQTYTRRPHVVQRPTARYPNSYIVFPQPQVTVTPAPTTTRAPPIRLASPSRPSYASRPVIRFTTPRPAYVTPAQPAFIATLKPVYVSTARPVVTTRNPRPPKVQVPVTPAPVFKVVTPSYPVLMVTPAPAHTGHTLSFPQSAPSSSSVRFRSHSSGFRPLVAFNGYLVTPAPSHVFPRSIEEQDGIDLVASSSNTDSLTASSQTFEETVPSTGNEFTSSAAELSPPIAIVPESATELIATVKGCGRRITEEEFRIDSPDYSPDLFEGGFLTCTYTIAK